MIQNFIIGILCTIITVFPIYKLFVVQKNIKKCWKKIKCTPIGQLLHPIFGPKGISSSENSKICDSGKFSAMYASKISSITSRISSLNDIVTDINGDIDIVKDKIYDIKLEAINQLKTISKIFLKTFLKINNLFIMLLRIINRLMKIFGYVIKLGNATRYSFQSMWNGPLGKMVKTFGSLF